MTRTRRPNGNTTDTDLSHRQPGEITGDLLEAVVRSKNTYDSDVDSLRSSLHTIDEASPVVLNMKHRIFGMLSESSYDNAYDRVIHDLESPIG